MTNSSHITRRDFLNGMLLTLGSTLVPPLAPGDELDPLFQHQGYPPHLSGMRGSHPGAFEVAHQLGMGGKTDWGAIQEDEDPGYDLIVVGAGISGLAAARFFQTEHGQNARILVLDNHADFGGHATRNEFSLHGQIHLNYGGSQSMEPDEYSARTRALLKDIGVNITRFDSAYDLQFFERHDLGPVTFFDEQTYGRNHLARNAIYDLSGLVPGLKKHTAFSEEAIADMPLTERAKTQLFGLLQAGSDGLKTIPFFKRMRYANRTPYFTYLKEQLGVDDPQVLHLLRYIPADDWGMGSDVLSLAEAIWSGAPGLNLDDWYDGDEEERPYIHHFPDGNASIARLLVRKLIPKSAPGTSMDDIVLAQFDYDRLDTPQSRVRIRLNSTVVHVSHNGKPKTAKDVSVTYISNGQARRVRAKHCVLACYNRIIPHLMPELPVRQKAALQELVKIPLVYSTVLIDNWQAFKTLGIGAVMCPGNLHHLVLLDYPVTLGGYSGDRTPDQPMTLTMLYVPLSDQYGQAPKEQFRQGRYKLLSMTFDDFERAIKHHLGAMLGPAGFNPETDIRAITVNRWPHGYSYDGSELYDPDITGHLVGRKTFGRVAIANCDAESRAYMDASIDQAWRAVKDL